MEDIHKFSVQYVLIVMRPVIPNCDSSNVNVLKDLPVKIAPVTVDLMEVDSTSSMGPTNK